MRKSLSALAAFATLVAAMLCVPSTALASAPVKPAHAMPRASIGIYPDVVRFTGALRGAEYESGIGIVNDTPHGEWFDLSLVGGAAPWLRVVDAHHPSHTITRLWVPPLVEGTAAIVKLQVPATLADGTYGAQLRAVTAAPVAQSRSAVSLRVGAVIDILIRVTATQVINGKLINAYTFPKIEVGTKVPVFALVENRSNVTVQPHFSLVVSRPNSTRAVYVWRGTTGEGLLPDQEATYELDWPGTSTLSQTLGKYVAHLEASYGARSFGTWALPFQLVPYGSLHRGGHLLALRLVNKPTVGGYAEIQASVASNGEAQEETTFFGQLYRNGTLVQPVKSPVPILLQPSGQPGDDGLLTIPVQIRKSGRYRLTGAANFAGAQSTVKTLTFVVGSEGIPIVYEVVAGAAIVVVLLVLFGALFARSRRRRSPPGYHRPAHAPPHHSATHARTLHVPPKAPVGSAPGRSARARRS